MAILVDLNQVLIAGIMVQIGGQKNLTIDEDMVRPMVLNILRNHIKKFKSEYGDVILCCDNENYWRKAYFPFYKAHRKKSREASPIDWNMIFKTINVIRQELKDNFPYKMINVANAEADDVIGVLSPLLATNEKVLIISSDGDFLQLQKYKNVNQYSPKIKKMLKTSNPEMDLKQKIIGGDKGDGIPNMLSPHNTFVLGIRQKTMTEKKMEQLSNIELTESSLEGEQYNYYIRNKTLIDFNYIPSDIRTNIVDTYNDTKANSRMKLFNYLAEKKLKNLMEVIEDF
jgi:5'-3' exonuclease